MMYAGHTALHHAARQGMGEVAFAILARTEFVHAWSEAKVDGATWTAVDLAVANGHMTQFDARPGGVRAPGIFFSLQFVRSPLRLRCLCMNKWTRHTHPPVDRCLCMNKFG